MAGRIRVFIAMSIDGFIAGPDDDLSWLPEPGDDDVEFEDTFTPFFAEIGAMLMGRRTFDVASSFPVPWPYGETPVHVATRRPLPDDAPSAVQAVTGTIHELVASAKQAADGRDVYLDGGNVIRQALDAGLIDELIITVISVVLGDGVPLFAGSTQPHALVLKRHRQLAPSMVELTYLPK